MSGLATQDDATGVVGESQWEYFISRRRIILGSHLWAGMPVRESIWEQARISQTRIITRRQMRFAASPCKENEPRPVSLHI